MNRIITFGIFLSLVFILVFSGSHFACSSGDPPQAPFQTYDGAVQQDMKKKADQLTGNKDGAPPDKNQKPKDYFVDVIASDAFADVLSSDGM